MSGAVISRVQLAAAHDGEAEMVVTLRYEDGGEALGPLDEHAVRVLLESYGANDPDELGGKGRGPVRGDMGGSSNLFITSQPNAR